jgi:hypothetical protein
MNPAEEQARRDYEESVRQGREREERARAEQAARELEMRKLEEIQRQQREEQARLMAERARRNHPNW